jgi:redox-sensitive bicupin YhaK (pirin superfamily)
VQWMTAGRGIIHSEMPHGDEPVHLLQLWLNLPASKKRVDTRYQDLRAADMPVRQEPGARLRVYSGASGSVRASTLNHWPITMVEARLDAGAEVTQELPPRANGFIYVLAGSGRFGADETPAHTGQVLHLAPSHGDDDGASALTVRADEPLFALLFAGEPIREPVVARGPFVMNTLDEVNQAYADYHAGRFGD